MRYALPGSALVHATVLGVALIGFAWPEGEDAPAPAPVTVDIVAVATVSTNASQVVESDATVSAVSAGAQPTVAEPVVPPRLEPTTEQVEAEEAPLVRPVDAKVEASQPPATVEAQRAESAQPLEPSAPAESIAAAPVVRAEAPVVSASEEAPELTELTTTAISPLQSLNIAPVAPAQEERQDTASVLQPTSPPSDAVEAVVASALAPLSSEDLKVAPVPRTLSFERPSAPTVPKPQPPTRTENPQPRTQQQTATRQQTQRPPSQAGNGGQNDGDSAAASGGSPRPSGAGTSGEADIARYSSQVRNKVMRAARGRDRGEVWVRFTVQANGAVSGVRIVRSSGSATTDEAGLSAVQRAAPFPPPPGGSMTFDVPLAFGG
jgi:protein TonB